MVTGQSMTMAAAAVAVILAGIVVVLFLLALFLAGCLRWDAEEAGAGGSRDNEATSVRRRLEEQSRLELESSLEEVDPEGDPDGDPDGAVRLPTINGDPRGSKEKKKSLLNVIKVAKVIDQLW